MLAEPFLMSGAARGLTETTLEQLVFGVVTELEGPTVLVCVPGPVVVSCEKKVRPCFRALERYGAPTTKAASNMRATTISAAARPEFRGLSVLTWVSVVTERLCGPNFKIV